MEMTENQQFCLRWNNHHSTLVSVFSSLLDSNTFADCTLVASGKQAKVHKMVLSACSPYLKELLVEHTNAHPIIILDNVKSYELSALVEFMYCGEVNILQEHLNGFLKAADSLQIKGLTGERKPEEITTPEAAHEDISEASEDNEIFEDSGLEFSKVCLNNGDSMSENISQPAPPEAPSVPKIKMEKFEFENEVSNHILNSQPNFTNNIGYNFYNPSYGMSQFPYSLPKDPIYTTPTAITDLNRPRKWPSSDDQEFKCDVCNKRYRSKTSLNLHKRWECGREPQFQCPFCLKKTHQKGNLKVHIMSGFVCSRCGKIYCAKHVLSRHQRFECGIEPQFECPVCGKKSKRQENLKLHIALKHSNIRM